MTAPKAKQYPSWRYSRDGQAKIIQTPEEDAQLGPDWADNPGAFRKKPEPPKSEKPRAAKGGKKEAAVQQ